MNAWLRRHRWEATHGDTKWRIPAIIGFIILALLWPWNNPAPQPAGDSIFDYQWTQDKAPSPLPWNVIEVENPDAMCRSIGALHQGRILGCAQPTRWNCNIIVPIDSPQWIVEHEYEHCRGKMHP